MNYLEEGASGPNLTLAMLPKSNKIILLEVSIIYYNYYNYVCYCVIHIA